MSNKNNKSSTATAVKTNSRSFAARLANSRGRLVGVTTVANDKVRNMVGQIKSVSPSYAVIKDRTRGMTKFALKTVLAIRGV